MKVSELVAAYIKLRDKKAALEAQHKAELAKLSTVMGQIEVKLLDAMNKNGMESIRTEFGTASKKVKQTCSVADWDAFFQFVQDEDAWHMITHAASKEAVKQYKDENGEIPPGLNWSETVVVGFQRS